MTAKELLDPELLRASAKKARMSTYVRGLEKYYSSIEILADDIERKGVYQLTEEEERDFLLRALECARCIAQCYALNAFETGSMNYSVKAQG